MCLENCVLCIQVYAIGVMSVLATDRTLFFFFFLKVNVVRMNILSNGNVLYMFKLELDYVRYVLLSSVRNVEDRTGR